MRLPELLFRPKLALLEATWQSCYGGFVMKEDSWRTIRGSTNYKCADGSKNGFAPV